MSLTVEEIAFLNKIEERKQKHKQAQAKYRASNKDKIADYNKKYNQEQKDRMNSILSKQPKIPQPTPINIQQIAKTNEKIDKRTREGKKQKTGDIKPFYETRKQPLAYSTIEDYIDKAAVIHGLFFEKPLLQEVKAQLRKLLNDNKSFDEKLILSEMTYINNDIEPTINTLRENYKNDNSFKTYLNILVVITSHLTSLNKSVYQTLTKLNIYMNKKIQDKRKENKLDEGDEGKIINLDLTEILTNIEKLKNIKDKLIYGLYTLFPARREEWRFTKLTTETNKDKLIHPVNNYLILSNPKRVIFNNYKTSKTYGQQDFQIDDRNLNNILDAYITSNKLEEKDYLFGLDRNKKEIISQPNFSKLISNVFFKVHNIPISLRFLRMSHISRLLKTNPTIKQMETLAFYMANSVEEQRKYNKILQ
jgi:hypothetical protein